MQPDVPPPPDGQAVAEPLVRELVRDQPLRPAPPSMWLAPNTDSPCASSGISRSSSVTTTVYAANGYGPEHVLEQRDHLRAAGRGRARAAARSRGGTSASWRGPVGTRRSGRSGAWRGSGAIGLRLLVHPPRAPGARRARDQAPVGDDLVAGLRRDREPVARPCPPGCRGTGTSRVRRRAGPRRSRRRSAPPSRPRPTGRATGRGLPGVAARRSTSARARGDRSAELDAIRPSRCVHRSGPLPVDEHLADAQPAQGERAGPAAARRGREHRARPSSRFVATR